METPLITEIFKTLSIDFSNSVGLLKPIAIQMLAWFFMYELATSLLLAGAGTNPLIILKDKVKIWAFLYAITYYFDLLMNGLKEIFQYFTQIVIGEAPGKIEELPYLVIVTAYKSMNSLLDYVSWHKPSTWVLFVGFIVGLFIFARICLTIGMVVLEYLVMSSLVIVLVPFMMFEKLRFVGDKVIGTLINLNMKIFVIQYLMYHFSEFLRKPLVTDNSLDFAIENSFYWLTAMGMLALVVLRGSEMAQTLISGVTSFGDSSELIGMARTGLGRLSKGLRGSIIAGKVGKGTFEGAKSGAVDGGLKGSISDGGIGATIGSYLGGIKGGLKGGYDSYKKR